MSSNDHLFTRPPGSTCPTQIRYVPLAMEAALSPGDELRLIVSCNPDGVLSSSIREAQDDARTSSSNHTSESVNLTLALAVCLLVGKCPKARTSTDILRGQI